MVELSRHIERLLLDYDCVIVPGLGGFVTQYVPARWLEEESLFLPPYRTVGFNPKLVLNDGLLVQSYMQAYDSSYPETQALIDEAVADMKECLQQKGSYELGGIGRLVSKLDGGYEFEPCEAGVLSPELYGLYSFTIGRAERDAAEGETAAETPAKKPKVKKKVYTFNVNREFVNYVAAAVVALFFYFLWAIPLSDDICSTKGEASFCSPVFPAAVKKAVPAATPEKVSVSENAPALPAKAEPVSSEAYTIVLASAVSRKNADLYVAQLQEAGLQKAVVYVKRKMVRVVYGSYADEGEAYGELSRLRKSPLVSDGWVMKLDK